ncbi:hypothetical protein PV05_08489 [Exophiala xenobiotica]|uniref:VOC domain-containing protein n=1 Tax=Exophiala xenobiotica TaxID=348802 RepID=A0A0D2BK76_9EURO|nr:uncharacterized protein PV05_08489 [Exophiala xenobiotica]KIW52876.1 hypothetical protein PV05_08489 [Exophiala xenobiotica]
MSTPSDATSTDLNGNSHPKVVSPYKLAHVVLRTSQYKTMLGFYRTFLGASVPFDNGELGFLRYDDEHHRIAIAGLPNTEPKHPLSSGLWHIAFTFRTLEDLLTAYTQRKAHGILPKWCVNHGPTTSMYYLDPDGNQIETQIDNFEGLEGADAYMRSHSFEENPIGVDFDPDELVEMLKKGVDEDVIKRRIDAGPRDLKDLPAGIVPVA